MQVVVAFEQRGACGCYYGREEGEGPGVVGNATAGGEGLEEEAVEEAELWVGGVSGRVVDWGEDGR